MKHKTFPYSMYIKQEIPIFVINSSEKLQQNQQKNPKIQNFVVKEFFSSLVFLRKQN